MRNGLTRVCWVQIARLGRIDIPLDSLAHDDQFRPYCSCAPVISIKQQGRKSELGFDQIQDERSETKGESEVSFQSPDARIIWKIFKSLKLQSLKSRAIEVSPPQPLDRT